MSIFISVYVKSIIATRCPESWFNGKGKDWITQCEAKMEMLIALSRIFYDATLNDHCKCTDDYDDDDEIMLMHLIMVKTRW